MDNKERAKNFILGLSLFDYDKHFNILEKLVAELSDVLDSISIPKKGWRLVPEEPTNEMIFMGLNHPNAVINPLIKAQYKAMVASAPIYGE